MTGKNNMQKLMLSGPSKFKPNLGRDFLDQLGIKISQKPCPNIENNYINYQYSITKEIANEFPRPNR